MELINLPVTAIDINKYDENHRLVRFGNDSIVYNNNNGYPTNYRGRSLTWSVTNLASFYYHGNYVEYMYFSDGRRSVKRVNGRTINYIYDHNRIVCENSVSTDGVESNMFYIYGIDGTVSCILKDASKHFLLRDQLGNVVAIVSDDGTLECSYQYDPYGNTIVYDPFGNVDLDPASIGNTNPFRYRGYYYDVETSLYYITSRYYDPEIGRFISPDSVDYLDPSTINGLNLYAYCGNDPINRIDPTGHVATSAIAIGALIGLITAYLADVFLISMMV